MNKKDKINWSGSIGTSPTDWYLCAHCGTKSHPLRAWVGDVIDTQTRISYTQNAAVLICPSCTRPTYINDRDEIQIPNPRLGADLKKLPTEVQQAYNEARDCSSVGAHTATVMLARKILMYLAVVEGAETDLKFVQYVNFLADKGHVPPKGKDWVGKIRDKGNEANHELPTMTSEDASEIMHLVEMLLRFNYEMV